jgi:glycosyltransferase involved in cell wall biosynthesis
MKVLVIAAGPFPFGRGTPARTLRVSQALASRGHEVCVAAFPIADQSIETDLRIERSRGLRSYRKTSPGPSLAKLFFMSPGLATKVRELLKHESFDVIYAHHYEGLLVASIARRRSGIRVPIIFDSHTLLGSELSFYFPKFLGRPVARIGAILDGYLIRYADAIISVTDEISNFYAWRSGPDLPILTATNGVEYRKFIRASASGGGASPVRAVFAGNLSSYQGIDLLLAAFRIIRLQRQDIELLIASPEADDVLASMGINNPGDEGILVRSGGFNELPSILASADIATNPRTVCAGIPQKLLNYMAAGLPTVSFEGSSAILVHEKTGLIVPNGDIDAFSGAIMRLADASDLRLRLGSAARALIEAEYNWERVAATFERVCHILGQ